MSTNTLIMGVGNTLLSDEGAGIHALNLIQSRLDQVDGFTFLDAGTLSFTLAPWIEDCDNLIVFDATELHLPAGTVKSFTDEKMDHFLGTSKRSAHEVGLLDLLDIARITDHLPEHRALIGIQPAYMDWGMKPTPAVSNALPEAVSTAEKIIGYWQILNTGQVSSGKNHYSEDRVETKTEMNN